MKPYTFIAAVLLLASPTVFAECETDSPRRGYWFYRECAPEAPADPYELPPLPPHSELMAMHPKELAKVIDERLEYAIYKRTPEATADYYVAMDAARRKSLAFTALSEYVMMTRPELNAKVQNPVTTPARNQAKRVQNESIRYYLSNYRNSYALIMLSQETCDFCRIQDATLANFSEKYNWRYRVLDIARNPELAARFNPSVTPTTLLIKRGTQEWLPVSVGAESVVDIEQGTYRAIRMLEGEISPEQYILQDSREGGFFDPTESGGL